MILIKNGHVVDPLSGLDKKMDILVDGENVVEIGENIEAKDGVQLIDATGNIVSPGFIDVHVHFRDPGFTHKEDIITGANSAAAGGYTTVVCMANTKPVVDNVETLEYVLEKAKQAKIEVLQVATITEGMRGQKLIDMKLLKEKGAAGFSDDGIPILDSKVVVDAMNMAKELNMPLSFHEEDPNLISENGINSGVASKWFNIEGSPHQAEDALVARDVALALSSGAKVNVQHISSAIAIELVRWAKSMGANVVAEVTPHHFSIIDEEVIAKGSNAKMNPPLRTAKDKAKIIEALKDNTLEIIATDHAPHTKEEKTHDEIAKTPSGIVGLETALSLCVTNLIKPGHLTYMEVIEKLTVNPAKLYDIDRGYIKEGHRADIVIFNPTEDYLVDNFESKSNNSPFIGQELTGRVKYTIHKGELVYVHNS